MARTTRWVRTMCANSTTPNRNKGVHRGHGVSKTRITTEHHRHHSQVKYHTSGTLISFCLYLPLFHPCFSTDPHNPMPAGSPYRLCSIPVSHVPFPCPVPARINLCHFPLVIPPELSDHERRRKKGNNDKIPSQATSATCTPEIRRENPQAQSLMPKPVSSKYHHPLSQAIYAPIRFPTTPQNNKLPHESTFTTLFQLLPKEPHHNLPHRPLLIMHIPLRPIIPDRMRERLAVAREGQGGDGAPRGLERAQPAARAHVPHVEGAVATGGGEHVAVGRREADCVDGVDVCFVGLGGGGGAVAFEGEAVEAAGCQ